METNLDKVRAYYASFDEWGRLDAPEGARELTRALEILTDKLAPGARVLDLGGGPGRYAIELARRGHRVVLADLSPELLEVARRRVAETDLAGIESFDAVHAADLGRYADGSFDAVIAFGIPRLSGLMRPVHRENSPHSIARSAAPPLICSS
ncbi:MAG TPA: methyltransferase domain-containing protein [Kofleriaceae bacterium]|nr:methyltransferase domain-containing protein [Kofleriaceae bacterium]